MTTDTHLQLIIQALSVIYHINKSIKDNTNKISETKNLYTS